MKDKRGLTPRQALFVAEYLVDLNATQAAIRAGYSARTAEQQGPRLLGYVGIADAIKKGTEKQLAKVDATAERVIQELSRIAVSDPRAMFDEAGHLKAPKDWPDDVAAAIAGIEVEQRRLAGTEIETIVSKVKRWDKTRALELLAKYYRLLSDRVEVTGKDGEPLEMVHFYLPSNGREGKRGKR